VLDQAAPPGVPRQRTLFVRLLRPVPARRSTSSRRSSQQWKSAMSVLHSAFAPATAHAAGGPGAGPPGAMYSRLDAAAAPALSKARPDEGRQLHFSLPER
jgi:hypothetical protein